MGKNRIPDHSRVPTTLEEVVESFNFTATKGASRSHSESTTLEEILCGKSSTESPPNTECLPGNGATTPYEGRAGNHRTRLPNGIPCGLQCELTISQSPRYRVRPILDRNYPDLRPEFMHLQRRGLRDRLAPISDEMVGVALHRASKIPPQPVTHLQEDRLVVKPWVLEKQSISPISYSVLNQHLSLHPNMRDSSPCL